MLVEVYRVQQIGLRKTTEFSKNSKVLTYGEQKYYRVQQD